MRCCIVIPARMASVRFPGKPLVDLLGKPMVQWVYEAALRTTIADRILVATPDEEIIAACEGFGAEAVITRADHPSGTDRIAEIADRYPAEVYVNVQGDEPLIEPRTIEACAAPLLADATIPMGSLFAHATEDEIDDPAVVKVVTDRAGFALYFSRHSLPFPRNVRQSPVKRHLGVYAYRRESVAAFSHWGPSELELTEGLEQLRFLENGIRIRMSFDEGSPLAVDTPDQADEVRAILRAR